MDEDTELAALMKRRSLWMDEFEGLVARLLALGEVTIPLPPGALEEICRPLTPARSTLPTGALRA